MPTNVEVNAAAGVEDVDASCDAHGGTEPTVWPLACRAPGPGVAYLACVAYLALLKGQRRGRLGCQVMFGVFLCQGIHFEHMCKAASEVGRETGVGCPPGAGIGPRLRTKKAPSGKGVVSALHNARLQCH